MSSIPKMRYPTQAWGHTASIKLRIIVSGGVPAYLQVGFAKSHFDYVIAMNEQWSGLLRRKIETQHPHIFIFQHDSVVRFVGCIQRDRVSVGPNLVLSRRQCHRTKGEE